MVHPSSVHLLFVCQSQARQHFARHEEDRCIAEMQQAGLGRQRAVVIEHPCQQPRLQRHLEKWIF